MTELILQAGADEQTVTATPVPLAEETVRPVAPNEALAALEQGLTVSEQGVAQLLPSRFTPDTLERPDYPGAPELKLNDYGVGYVPAPFFHGLGQTFGYALRLTGDYARFVGGLDVARDGNVYFLLVNEEDPHFWRRVRGRVLARYADGSRTYVTNVGEPERIPLLESLRGAPLVFRDGECQVSPVLWQALHACVAGETWPVVFEGTLPPMGDRGEVLVQLTAEGTQGTCRVRFPVIGMQGRGEMVLVAWTE